MNDPEITNGLSGPPVSLRRSLGVWLRWVVLPIALLVFMACLDTPVATWVHTHPFPTYVKWILRAVRLPGHIGLSIVVAVVIIWPCRCDWRIAVAMLSGGVAASVVTAVLKWCFGRVRPFRGRDPFDWNPFPSPPLQAFSTVNLSFPSGDATLAFATATVVAKAFPRFRYVAFGWASLVAVTRVLQGAHYPSDVTAGAFVGIAVASLLLTRWKFICRPSTSAPL